MRNFSNPACEKVIYQWKLKTSEYFWHKPYDNQNQLLSIKARKLQSCYNTLGLCVVAVKVVLVPDGYVMTVAFAISLSIQELKHHLASALRVPADVLQISLDGLFLSPPFREF